MRWLRSLLAALSVALLSGRAPQAEPIVGDDFAPRVRRLMERDRIPGIAIGVVDRGRLVEAHGYGERDVGAHLPVTPDTLFALGSASKTFTSAAIALLADEDAIALDRPVRVSLPDFALRDPVATETVTTRDLLTHRTGLPRHDLFWYRAPFSRDELCRRLRFLEPSGPPHARWRYDSLGFVVAGEVVERVSGRSWESFVSARILRPLGMRRTRLSPDEIEDDPDHASPYALRDGRLRAIPRLTPMHAIAPAGAVHSSVRELARWLAFHTSRSPPLLGERAWRELHRPQVDMPDAGVPELRDRRYALGWIHVIYRGHPLVLHDGAVDGFTAHLGFLPESGRGVIVLANRDDASAAVSAIAYGAYDRLLDLRPIDWEARLADESVPLRPIARAALDFPLDEVIGTYEHRAYGPLVIAARRDDLVMVLRTLRLTLAYLGERRFRSVERIADGGPQLEVRFSPPRAGEPMELVVPLNFEEGDPVEVFTRRDHGGATPARSSRSTTSQTTRWSQRAVSSSRPSTSGGSPSGLRR